MHDVRQTWRLGLSRSWKRTAGLFLLMGLLATPVSGANRPSSNTPAKTPAKPPSLTKPTPIPPSSQVYVAQCSFCHVPKPAKSQPDLKAWIRLLYTTGCPEVTVRLAESQRLAIKAYFEAELSKP